MSNMSTSQHTTTLRSRVEGNVHYIEGLSEPLRDALNKLNQLGIPAFVTRYPNAAKESFGKVLGVNQCFLGIANKQAGDLLDQTYSDIHGTEEAAKYTAGERAVMSNPGRHERINEGPGVEVVKIALTTNSAASGVVNDDGVYILGYFRMAPNCTETETLSPQMQQAQGVLAFLTNISAD